MGAADGSRMDRMEFTMDRGIVRVLSAEEHGRPVQNLAYWMSRRPEERLAAVEFLRKQFDGSGARLQRVLRTLERPPR